MTWSSLVPTSTISLWLNKEIAFLPVPEDPRLKQKEITLACFELVMLGAWAARVIDDEEVAQIYKDSQQFQIFDKTVQALIKPGKSYGHYIRDIDYQNPLSYTPPSSGDILFFDEMKHVAIATGGEVTKFKYDEGDARGYHPGYTYSHSCYSFWPMISDVRKYFRERFQKEPPQVVTELPGARVDNTDIRTIAEFIEQMPTVKRGHKVRVQVGTPIWG